MSKIRCFSRLHLWRMPVTAALCHSSPPGSYPLAKILRPVIGICFGGIIGMGETRVDRCDLAFSLREIGANVVPINILNPIKGTPFGENPSLPVLEILKTIACFRFILPRQEIMIAGGRAMNLHDAQSLIFLAGASTLMVGNNPTHWTPFIPHPLLQ